MRWLPETIVSLRQLWDDGVPTAEIGRRLGCSKSAVNGKAHRLDFPSRPSPIQRSDDPARPFRQRHTAPNSAPATPMRAEDRRPPAAPASRPGVELPRLFPPLCECAWPMSNGKPWRSCGAPVEPGKPYCAEHYRASKGKAVAPIEVAA